MASKQSAGVEDSGQRPSLGAGLNFVRKSASHEPLGVDAFSFSRADNDTGTYVSVIRFASTSRCATVPLICYATSVLLYQITSIEFSCSHYVTSHQG